MTIVNLNKAQKARARAKKKARAAENAVKFGRTRGEKTRDKAETDRTARDINGHRRDD